jgi:benzoyl-CoA reductase subunit C
MVSAMHYDEPLFFGRDLPCDASLEHILNACRVLLRDMTFPTVRLWRDRGGKVLGHFQVYFPEEIAHAAGMLPVKLCCTHGSPAQADVHFGSYLCSVIKHSLNLALSCHVELDMFVAPSICDAARNLAAVWSRNFTYPCRTLYLPQNSANACAEEYLAGEYGELAVAVSGVTGRPVQDDDLRQSIMVYNRNRALLRELYALKAREPWKAPVDECYVLTAVGSLMPRQEHNRLLESALPLLDARPDDPLDKLRVILNGCFCEQPPLAMLEAMARTCHVVDDDLLIGLRWITGDIDGHGAPLASLARAYGAQSACSPVRHDSRTSGPELLVRRVRDLGARAAVITAPKMCEPGLEELVPAAAALDRAGIPYCLCEFEQTMTTFDMLELQLETFAENILFAEEPGQV